MTAALTTLLERVEAGTLGSGDMLTTEECKLIYACFPAEIEGAGASEWVSLAMDGSLDAARALHDALLPGWVKWNMQHSYFGYECDLTNGDCDASGVSKDNPARAWLLAILRALKSQVNHD